MRVISGKYKRRLLSLDPKADHLRPTGDRVKENLFNILQPELTIESVVLDLFCGSGSLGIEALSRGARHCVFVDKHPKSLSSVKNNLQSLSVPEEDYTIVSCDADSFLHHPQHFLFDLVLVDPPYNSTWYTSCFSYLSRLPLAPHALIAIERGDSSPEFEKIEGSPFIEESSRTYGTTSLHFLRYDRITP